MNKGAEGLKTREQKSRGSSTCKDAEMGGARDDLGARGHWWFIAAETQVSKVGRASYDEYVLAPGPKQCGAAERR